MVGVEVDEGAEAFTPLTLEENIGAIFIVKTKRTLNSRTHVAVM
jgi:hypothetical protein